MIKNETKATIRCIPLKNDEGEGVWKKVKMNEWSKESSDSWGLLHFSSMYSTLVIIHSTSPPMFLLLCSSIALLRCVAGEV